MFVSLPQSLWVCLEIVVCLSVEKTGFSLVFKSKVNENLRVVIQYPFIVIQVDDEICCLRTMRFSVQLESI